MTGHELAKALRDLAHLVELQRSITGMQLEPLPGLTITIRVAGAARSTGKLSPSAERMRRHRALNGGSFGDELGDAQPSPTLKLGDAASKLGDTVADGGTRGGPTPDHAETSGKETGIIGTNLVGQDQETPTERHGSNSVTLLGDAKSVTLRRVARSDGTAEERAAVRRVFDAWQQDTGHHRAILDKKRGRKILQRLQEGFTPERLILAITHRRNDPWLMGKGDSPRVYDDIETLLRDAAQVERLERLSEPRAPGGAHAARNSGTELLERFRDMQDGMRILGGID
jgi:hypothetical protein